MINFTLSNLFIIALNAKQERSIVLEEDSNLINLAHRFYSLDLDDENIDELILNNDIGISEHLKVENTDILIIIPRDHNYFSNLFKKNLTNAVVLNTKIPLIAIHE